MNSATLWKNISEWFRVRGYDMKSSEYITPCGADIILSSDPCDWWNWKLNADIPNSPMRSIACSGRIYWLNGLPVIFCGNEHCDKMIYPKHLSNSSESTYGFCRLCRGKNYTGEFEQSHEPTEIAYWEWHFKRLMETGTEDCACVSYGKLKDGNPIIDYSSDHCNMFCPHGCEANVCFITKRKRENLKPVRILADIEYPVSAGTLFEHKVVEKGISLTTPMVTEIAERKMKEMQSYFEDESWKYRYGRALKGHKPTRLYLSRESKKDLLEDLSLVAEGAEIVHASDNAKKAVEAKRERKQERQILKTRKIAKNQIKKWLEIISTGLFENGEPCSETFIRHAKEELEKRNVDYKIIIENQQSEQTKLF